MAAVASPAQAAPGAGVDSSPGVELTAGDVARYRRIFALQGDGDMTAADREIAGLTDDRLMGHVLFQRYMHPTAWRSKFAELSGWLDLYGDHPGAERIFALAERRRPGSAPAPSAPDPWSAPRAVALDSPGACLDARLDDGARTVANRTASLLRRDRPTQALERLEQPETRARLSDAQFDRLLADIAASYSFNGLYDRATELAESAAERSGTAAPRALWVAGLMAWRRDDHAAAADHFSAMAGADCASAWGRSAAAFWAARSHLRNGQPEAFVSYMEMAAGHRRTFYGLLARRALGLDLDFAPLQTVAAPAMLNALSHYPAGRRAIGLLQVGRADLAGEELFRIRPNADDRAALEGMIALAGQAEVPHLTLALAGHLPPGQVRDAALYPVAPWRPDGGFSIDRALVNAVIRQESAFDTAAISGAGARGLMQLMPATARYVDGGDRGRLLDPEENLRIGQAYIARLIDHPDVGPDLIRLIVAYNVGPGNLVRWIDEAGAGDDPLLFIESLPSGYARSYIERVLADYWIYRDRLGQPTPSLDRIASGRWPLYMRLDVGGEVASRGRH